eukprot:c11502_g1_i2.p1 GENE.c11502_g1_i2~~c11502_g1_i2.p1  ORF type:complete len:193 (+),score=27.37 c11502_g1_i2:346-924(+)
MERNESVGWHSRCSEQCECSMTICEFPHAHTAEWDAFSKRHKDAFEAAAAQINNAVKTAKQEVKTAARKQRKSQALQDSVTTRTTLSNHEIAIQLGLTGARMIENANAPSMSVRDLQDSVTNAKKKRDLAFAAAIHPNTADLLRTASERLREAGQGGWSPAGTTANVADEGSPLSHSPTSPKRRKTGDEAPS